MCKYMVLKVWLPAIYKRTPASYTYYSFIQKGSAQLFGTVIYAVLNIYNTTLKLV